MKENINLSDHFTYKKLIQFTLPTIVMMIALTTFGVVDGFFVSNIVGTTAFAAINLVTPVIMIIGMIGFMFGTGGSAIISKTLGEGDKEKASEYFSLLLYTEIVLGLILSIIAFVFMEPIVYKLGATKEMINDCLIYERILLIGMVCFILQNSFQSFMIVAEKPKFGLILSVIAGIINVILDFVFIYLFKWAIAGAAIATVISQIVGAIIPIIYFFRENDTMLRLGKTKFELYPIIKTCINGASEMVTTISISLVNILFNFKLLELAGENGLSAYGVIMYVGFFFVGTYVGYSVGSAPIFSYHYGAKNKEELKNLFNKSLKLLAISAIVMTSLSEVLTIPLAKIFVNYDKELLDLTIIALRIYSLSYILNWFNIFASSFFTALNDGFVSALISFLRTFLFQVIMILTLPLIWGLNGIWISVAMAEICSIIVSLICYIVNRKKYEYV